MIDDRLGPFQRRVEGKGRACEDALTGLRGIVGLSISESAFNPEAELDASFEWMLDKKVAWGGGSVLTAKRREGVGEKVSSRFPGPCLPLIREVNSFGLLVIRGIALRWLVADST